MSSRRNRVRAASASLVLIACIILAISNCKKDEPRPEPVVVAQGAAAQKLITPTPEAPVASGTAPIKGAVTLSGTPPEMPMTKRDADPFCAKTPTKDEEVVVGKNGGLKNVIVRI